MTQAFTAEDAADRNRVRARPAMPATAPAVKPVSAAALRSAADKAAEEARAALLASKAPASPTASPTAPPVAPSPTASPAVSKPVKTPKAKLTRAQLAAQNAAEGLAWAQWRAGGALPPVHATPSNACGFETWGGHFLQGADHPRPERYRPAVYKSPNLPPSNTPVVYGAHL